jgi:hypothetical protein
MRLLVLAILAIILTPVAAYNGDNCCILAARQQVAALNVTPWDVCTDPNDESAPPNKVVTATMGWCISNCGKGIEPNTTSQWLQPLTTWVIPAVALILLCAVGEREPAEKKPIELGTSWHRILWLKGREFFNRKLRYPGQEYLILLGDPGSSLWGALSEVWKDLKLTKMLNKAIDLRGKTKGKNWFDTQIILVVVLAAQTTFEETKLTNGLILRGTLCAIDTAIEKAKDDREDRDKKERAEQEKRGLKPKKIKRDPTPDSIKDLKDCLEACLEDPTQLCQSNEHKSSVRAMELLRIVRRTLIGQEGYTLRRLLEALRDELRVYDQHGDALVADGKVDRHHLELLKELYGSVELVFATLPNIHAIVRESILVDILGRCESSANSDFAEKLDTGIKTVLKARIDFINGVFLPIVLALVATVAAFYDAYNNLGENETAHALAYGTWYCWTIVLAILSNCFAASVNCGVVREAIGDLVFLSDETLPIRRRHHNAVKWQFWIKTLTSTDRSFQQPEVPRTMDQPFWNSFLWGQTISWAIVGFACACAAAISYTTPTVGLGCRSFNHMIYGVGAFVVAWLWVGRYWLKERIDHLAGLPPIQRDKEGHGLPPAEDDLKGQLRLHRLRRSERIARWVYALFIAWNCLVIIAGSIFHLAGVWRSCRCTALFARSSAVLQLSPHTALDLANASKFWLPVGYVAFSGIWIISAKAIYDRARIHMHMSAYMEKDRRMEREEAASRSTSWRTDDGQEDEKKVVYAYDVKSEGSMSP